MNNNRYLTTSDLVARYGYHVGSIRRMIRQRRLPAVRVGKSYFFPPEAIAAFEAAHAVSVGAKIT
jgi:excisionase family DNA binding protein